MLQYIATTNDNYSIAEQAQMVIEGGCTWIVLRVPDMKDSELRELAQELVPLCKENATILTIENHAEMARELGLHGVCVSAGCKYSPAKVRELFGPEAIVGVTVSEASAALQLRNLDIDYVALPASMPLEKAKAEIALMRNADFALPIVVEGNFAIGELPRILEMGASGVAESKALIDAPDPVEQTQKAIKALKGE